MSRSIRCASLAVLSWLVVTGAWARERIIGGPCEGCENVFVGMPDEIGPVCRIAPTDEAGDAMILEGTVRSLDGKSAAGIVVYAYHTDATGIYPAAQTRHGRLRGWTRSDETGHYRFDTIRPGAYPGRTVPQHVHMHILEPGRVTYYIADIHFEDDPLLTKTERRRAATGRGGSGLVQPQRDARGVWHVQRDIVLGENVPGYPCPRRWTFPVPFHQSVSWSPDGAFIAFSAVTQSWEAGYRLFVMKADGTDLRAIDTNGDAALYPVWSPDGERIAFAAKRNGNTDIWIMQADGAQPRQLTANEANDTYPTWSPDGKRLAFTSDRSGNSDIWIMDDDGGGLFQVTDDSANDTNPAWSPDGRFIAFDSNRDGTPGDEIYLVEPDGRGLQQVVAAGVFPAWSPDGMRLLYASMDLHVVDRDGANDTRLLDNVVTASWSPDGRTIVAAAIEYDDRCRDHHVLVTLPAAGGAARRLLPE